VVDVAAIVTIAVVVAVVAVIVAVQQLWQVFVAVWRSVGCWQLHWQLLSLLELQSSLQLHLLSQLQLCLIEGSDTILK